MQAPSFMRHKLSCMHLISKDSNGFKFHGLYYPCGLENDKNYKEKTKVLLRALTLKY